MLVLSTDAPVLAQGPVWYPLDESPIGTPAEVLFDSALSDAGNTYFTVTLHGLR